MTEKSNNGSLTYYIDDPFFKMRVSVKFTNMNTFICKGISSSGNPFCSLSKDVRKVIQLDLNPIMGKDFSLNNTIFLNKFEQRLLVRYMNKFHKTLIDHSKELFRRNIIDGIERFEVVSASVAKYQAYENIQFASGKNIEFIPYADKTKDDTPFCGVMMSINHRSKHIIMTPDEFEYFIDLISNIDIDKCFVDAVNMMYLSDLNRSGKFINLPKQNSINTFERK